MLTSSSPAAAPRASGRRLPVLLASRTVNDEPPSAVVHFAAESGFDGVEVWVEDLWSHGEEPRAVRSAAEARGALLTCHAASYDVNPTSFNPGIRLESLRQILRSVEIAAEMGASVVTVHPGKTSTSADQPEYFWAVQTELYAAAVTRGRALGVEVSAEPMEPDNKYLVCLPDEVRRLLAAVPGLGYTVDVAHVHQARLTVAAYWDDA